MSRIANALVSTYVVVYLGVGALLLGFVGLAWLVGGLANAIYALLVLAVVAFVALVGFRVLVS